MMSSHRITTRSHSSRQNNKNIDNADVIPPRGDDDSSRRRSAAKKQTVVHDESDEDDDKSDESDEEDDENDVEQGGGTTTKTSRRGNNQQKKRTNTWRKSPATTIYKYPDDQFHISGWKLGLLPSPEEILERTQFYFERKMNEEVNYSNEELWLEFMEDGKEKGLFPEYWSPYWAKKYYNQAKVVAKGELPDQPFPNLESTEQIIEARVYSHHTGAALRKFWNDLHEYGRQNGIQGQIMIPHLHGAHESEACEKLRKLAEQGNEKAIKAYDFVHAVHALRNSSVSKGEHYAKSLVELLENDGIVGVLRIDDGGNYSAHERSNQEHCHKTFLRFVLDDESNDIQLSRKINLTRDPTELKEQIHEREDEKYAVHAKVTGICGMIQIEFCQDMIANAGGVEAIEEMHRNNLLSRSCTGLVQYLDKYHSERICEKCGLKAATCSSLQHKGAGAIRIKKQRGGKHPSDCTLEELETQDKLMKKCGDGSRFEHLCIGCHRMEDLSTLSRIAFGDVSISSDEARSYKNQIEIVSRYKAIQTARVEDHITDICSGEPLQHMDAPRNDAHHFSGCNQVALHDVASGEIFALDTAKRKHDSTMLMIQNVDSMEELVDQAAHWLASTVSMDANSHMILHVIIGMVERGQLNGGVLPFDCRGGYYIVPVSESENRDLYDILTKYKSWFEKIDAKKILACPRVSLKSGNILKENETEDEVAAVAQEDSANYSEVASSETPATPEFESPDNSGFVCPPTPTKDNDRSTFGCMNLHAEFDQIGRTTTASGDYTIIDDREMAPQVPGFGEYYEDEKPSSGFGIPFPLEPESGGEDSGYWFEADDVIIERERHFLEEIEELRATNNLLNKDVDQLTSVIGSYLGKLEESVPSDVVENAVSNLFETMENDNGHVEFLEKSLREKDEEIASAKASEESLEKSLRRKNKMLAMAKASIYCAVDTIDRLETDKEKLKSYGNELIDDISRLEDELENEKRNREHRETFLKKTITARDMEIAALNAMVEQLTIENSRLKEGDEGTRKRPRVSM